MSSKRSRRSLALRRGAAGLVVGGLGTTLVVVYVDRSGRHTETVDTSTPAAVTPVSTAAAPAALDGTYDVTVTVTSVEYGSTWPNPQLVTGQQVPQRWTIDCRATTCKIAITTGHISEDPDGATVATTDDKAFSVSTTAPATADDPALPPGCGQLNATDVQRLTLDTADAGKTFTGKYSIHHPLIHVDGEVGGHTASCDGFNVALDLSARRV